MNSTYSNEYLVFGFYRIGEPLTPSCLLQNYQSKSLPFKIDDFSFLLKTETKTLEISFRMSVT